MCLQTRIGFVVVMLEDVLTLTGCHMKHTSYSSFQAVTVIAIEKDSVRR